MNRQYSPKIVQNTPNIIYQNQKIIISPRHQPTVQHVTPVEIYKTNNGPSRISTSPKRSAVGSRSPFVNKLEVRRDSINRSPNRNLIVSPSPKPDPNKSQGRKSVEIQIKIKQNNKVSQVSLFQNKPNSGPIIDRLPNKLKQEIQTPCFVSGQSQKTSSENHHGSPIIYCQQQQVVNLIHGKVKKQLDKLAVQKQMLDSGVKQLKEGVQYYYDKLEERVRRYRKLDLQKITDYQKESIRYVHEFQSLFNKAMGDIINIKRDYTKKNNTAHDLKIKSLQDILLSYDKQKINKIHFIYNDISAIFPYQKISSLSTVNPSPPVASDPLIKFDTKLQVKEIVSSNLIINNPEFSFFDPLTASKGFH